MSFPNIPNITAQIDIDRDDVINLLLASVAFEELGLAHLINAEAEKVQFVLGTLPGVTVPTPTISDLININEAVRNTIVSVIKEEMLLQFKLENILKIPSVTIPPITNG
ncbi:hypothetical protein [Rossellomorea yichunensis]|uniref:hypothetical protein n=1 Tax=Rossellomorea yichunensis TaxID=3077331 RepID=UPI0028DDC8D6|nr:hypothetical protein [Rossellomorea sp. YC4-1]MDT9027825.1 hypothetical protein [Rossellomorea sp. YC4-1]